MEIACVHHDNFAMPTMRYSASPSSAASSSASPELRGAVIDNSLFNRTWTAQDGARHSHVLQNIDGEEAHLDLRAQLQQWLTFENGLYGEDRSTQAMKQRTVFFIWFAHWDLWYYSGGDSLTAPIAVTKSVDTLFEQLDLIAENWTSEPRIVLLNAIDLTLLPIWRKLRTGPYGMDSLAAEQRSAVRLVDQWNRALEKRASRWNKGQVYIYNINDWFLNQLRVSHVNKAKPVDVNGLGPDTTLWDNIRVGCLDSDRMTQDNADAVKCADPSSYLFW